MPIENNEHTHKIVEGLKYQDFWARLAISQRTRKYKLHYSEVRGDVLRPP